MPTYIVSGKTVTGTTLNDQLYDSMIVYNKGVAVDTIVSAGGSICLQWRNGLEANCGKREGSHLRLLRRVAEPRHSQ